MHTHEHITYHTYMSLDIEYGIVAQVLITVLFV